METITTAPQTPAAKSFTVRPLSPALGAEILGVDLREPIDEALKLKFLDTWHQHLVILLRDQTLDEDAQVRFAEMFGPPAPVTSGRSFSVKHPAVMLISNIRQDGKPIGARRELPHGSMHQPVPAKATCPTPSRS
jgi:taurine dioxygenase